MLIPLSVTVRSAADRDTASIVESNLLTEFLSLFEGASSIYVVKFADYRFPLVVGPIGLNTFILLTDLWYSFGYVLFPLADGCLFFTLDDVLLLNDYSYFEEDDFIGLTGYAGAFNFTGLFTLEYEIGSLNALTGRVLTLPRSLWLFPDFPFFNSLFLLPRAFDLPHFRDFILLSV